MHRMLQVENGGFHPTPVSSFCTILSLLSTETRIGINSVFWTLGAIHDALMIPRMVGNRSPRRDRGKTVVRWLMKAVTGTCSFCTFLNRILWLNNKDQRRQAAALFNAAGGGELECTRTGSRGRPRHKQQIAS